MTMAEGRKKMHFLLTTLKVVYVLTTPMPKLLEDATVEAIRIRAKWENDDYICRGHILNGMSDSLFDVYTNVESAKELWDSLESKYMAEDSSSKKFLCGKTGHFKRDCRSGNKSNANAGGSGKGSKDHSQDQGLMQLIAVESCMKLKLFYTQQNGVAERKNRALKEMVNSMLSYSGLKSRDAIFDENRFSSIPRPKDIIPNSDESQRDDHSDDVPSEIPEPRKGKRVRKAKSYGFDFQLYLVEGSRDQVGSQYSYCYTIEKDPRTYNEAMQSRDSVFWKEAIDDEIGSIMEK
ncbi:zinc finger, CCHC-type containing protein [Tanacetum coccineum]